MEFDARSSSLVAAIIDRIAAMEYGKQEMRAGILERCLCRFSQFLVLDALE
jgi:hypothetical protein